MHELIKQIRIFLDMSQSAFADSFGVSFATINRWENGRSVPNRLAQMKLYELCKAKAVPAYEMILQQITETAQKIQTESGRVVLYHGSKSGLVGQLEPKSRKQCDFGCGFYMGTDPAQALTLICDYDKSKLYLISVNLQGLSVLNVPVSIDWAMLVAYHRGRMESIKNTSFYEKYRRMSEEKDVIIGSIADDRMFYAIDNFFVGNITDAALVHSLSALQLGKQYVAVSKKGCEAIRIEGEKEFSYFERLVMKDAAEENRSRGITFANDICKRYRREGKFFDEILDEARNGGVSWTQSH